MTPADLLAFRERMGLSQQQLAQLLGVNHMTVYRWEKERREIPSFLELALRQLEENPTQTP